jgi:tRNA (mo5U34)-methyltransferase
VISAYCDDLERALDTLALPWRQTAGALTRQRLIEQPHGDVSRWLSAVEGLPDIEAVLLPQSDVVSLQAPLTPDSKQQVHIASLLRELKPWRKGPFNLFGVPIDTEWRSDWKWQRIAPHIEDLKDRVVLDVGCGSGYHCWRMAGAGARAVLGIDPTLLYFFQYLALHRYAVQVPVWYAPVRLEEMPMGAGCFDTVFSMGVLYHRRSPLDHLLELFGALRPGGQLVLETLVIEGNEQAVLIPEDRYAAMRNVFFLPSASLLERWLRRSGFIDVRTVDVSVTTVSEQRPTDWMTFQSLRDFLDPEDPSRTVEGYPAPRRAALVASRPAR